MAEFILKVKGPQRELEVQIPVGITSGPKLSKLASKISDALTEEEPEEEKGFFKMRKSKSKGKAQKATTTAGVLLASVILAALSSE